MSDQIGDNVPLAIQTALRESLTAEEKAILAFFGAEGFAQAMSTQNAMSMLAHRLQVNANVTANEASANPNANVRANEANILSEFPANVNANELSANASANAYVNANSTANETSANPNANVTANEANIVGLCDTPDGERLILSSGDQWIFSEFVRANEANIVGLCDTPDGVRLILSTGDRWILSVLPDHIDANDTSADASAFANASVLRFEPSANFTANGNETAGIAELLDVFRE